MPVSPSFCSKQQKADVPSLVRQLGEKYVDPFLMKLYPSYKVIQIDFTKVWKKIPPHLRIAFVEEFKYQYMHWEVAFCQKPVWWGWKAKIYIIITTKEDLDVLEEAQAA